MATQQKTEEKSRSSQARDQSSRAIQRQPTAGALGLPFSLGPFALIRRMQDDFDRLFGGVSRGQGSLAQAGQGQSLAQGDWIPTVEAFQRDNEFVIRLDLPGVAPDDVTIDVGDDAVTIRGERKYEHEEEREGMYVSERAYGAFVRVVPLQPGAIADDAKATFRDGVLEIVVPAPSQEATRGRRLEINKESSDRGEGAREREREQRRS